MDEFLGVYLKKTRESKGLTLDDIVTQTRIQKRYIEAIENEQFNEIPGETYVKGFLRNYASTVGLNPDEVIEKYKKQMNLIQEKVETEEKNKEIKKTNRTKKLLIVLLTIVILYIIWTISNTFFNESNYSKNKNLVLPEEPKKTINENSPKVDESSFKIKETEFKSIKLTAIKDVNIKVIDGKDVFFKGVLKKGETKEIFSKNVVFIEAEEGNSLKVEYNGKISELGGKQRVGKEF